MVIAKDGMYAKNAGAIFGRNDKGRRSECHYFRLSTYLRHPLNPAS